MLAACPKCGKSISVPASRVSQPDYQVKCLACQTMFRPSGGSVDESIGSEAPKEASPVSASASAPGGKSTSSIDWRHCVNHSTLRSEAVCPVCKKGFCRDCCRSVQTAFICNECDGLCLPPDRYAQRHLGVKQRSRSMLEELPTILTYPFVDRVSFMILGIIVWVFSALGSFAMMYGGGALLFSQGLMMAYSFSAMARVSVGNMKSYLPEINDIYDLIKPLWLGLAALLISSIGIIALLFLYPGATLFQFGPGAESEEEMFSSNAVYAQLSPDLVVPVQGEDETSEEEESEDEEVADEEEGEEEETEDRESPLLSEESDYEDYDGFPMYVTFLLILAFAWKLFYGPAALAVAGVSQSFLQTLNPLVGLDTIRRLGSVYWITMIIYSFVTITQTIVTLPLAAIPFVGSLIKAFIDCYAALVTGCALGLALQKKAPELGLE